MTKQRLVSIKDIKFNTVIDWERLGGLGNKINGENKNAPHAAT